MPRTVEQTSRDTPLIVRLGISWLTNALILGIVTALLTDVRVSSFGKLLEAAVVFGILNTVLKPLVRLVTLPLAVLTLGVAWFFVSLLMLWLTDDIVSGFTVHGFGTLILATAIIWVVNMILDVTPGPWQITGKRRRRHEIRGS